MGTLLKRKPAVFYILLFFMVFLAVSGLAGGISLTADPTGGLLKMPLSFLEGTPFKNYLLPGLFLLIVLGITSRTGHSLRLNRGTVRRV